MDAKLDKMMHETLLSSPDVSHLEEEKGLLSLMKQKGYSLKPIKVTR